MKNHPWVIGFVALSLAAGGCDKLGIGKDDKAGKASDSATASSDAKTASSSKEGDKKADKGDAKTDGAGKADGTAKPDASKPGDAAVATPAAAGSALSHLTDDCQVAAHVDLAQIVANPSFQKEIVPGLDDVLSTSSSKDKDFVEFQAFLKETGLDYKKSIRDVAICVTDVKDAEHNWSVMIGTDMKPDTLAPALAKSAKKGAVEDLDGHKVFVKDAVTIGQAADGVVIIAATKAVYQKASAAKGASAYSLDASKYLAFTVREQAMSVLLGMDKGTPDQFKSIKSVKGAADLAALKTEIVADCGTADDAKKLDAMVTLMKDEFLKKAAGSPGEAVLKSLASHIDGSNVVVDLQTPQDAFDQGLKMVGTQLKDAKTKL